MIVVQTLCADYSPGLAVDGCFDIVFRNDGSYCVYGHGTKYLIYRCNSLDDAVGIARKQVSIFDDYWLFLSVEDRELLYGPL